MMRISWRRIAVLIVLAGWLTGSATAAELKPIKTQKAKDLHVRLLSESGEWKQGKNSFVLEFTSVKDGKPADVGKVRLNTAMPMPGMAPMLAGATLEPDAPRAVSRHHQLPRQRRSPGHRGLGRAGRQGLDEIHRKEEAEGRWDASVNVGYQRQDFGYGLQGLTESGARRPIQDVFHYFGGGVSIMLPVRNQNQGNVAAARAEMTAAERRQEFMVYVATDEEGRFVEKRVTLGAPVGDAVQVLDGVEPGEKVVTEGSFFLRAEAARVRSSG